MLGVWVVVRERVSPGCDILPRVSWVSVVGVGNGGYEIGVLVLFAIAVAVSERAARRRVSGILR